MPKHLPGLGAGLFVVCVAALWLATPALSCEKVVASYYCCEFHGRTTASGATFNQNAMTAAMPARKHLGQRYRVTAGGKSVVVRITDTGGFAKYGRVIDLSRGAFAKLAPTSKGVIRVCLERVG